MCGIAGFFHPTISTAAFPNKLSSMLALQHHRGPDEVGLYYDDEVGLGSTRLSIIDLGGGQQPISAHGDRYWIVYNGEVYNYLELRKELKKEGISFKTASDTEVVLQAFIQYGIEGINKLNGNFAFAIYDRLERSIYLARDRFGQRPAFYTYVDGAFYFSSEIKSFLALDRLSLELDLDKLSSIFYTWGSLPHLSAFKGIQQVPNGCCIKISPEGLSQHPYYQLDFNRAPFDGSFDEAVEITKEKLLKATKLRLRSDVEVGTYLSGGLDSTITTAIAQENTSRTIRTFSIAFEQQNYDESSFQQQASLSLGTKHEQLLISNQDIVKSFPSVLWHAEIPMFRTAPVPMYLLSQMVNNAGIKVILTGEASDESFLGYNIFKETILREKWSALDKDTQRQEVLQLYPYLEHFTTENAAALISTFNRFASEKDDPLFSHQMRFFNTNFSRRLLNKQPEISPTQILLDYSQHSLLKLNIVQRAQWLEFNTLLSGYLLSTQGDRVALGNSVENRAPFLDVEVVEWAQSLPLSFKLNQQNEKFILKAAFQDKIPTSIVKRPKQPYRAPDALPFIQDTQKHEYLELLWSEAERKKATWLNQSLANKFINKLRAMKDPMISPSQDQAFLLLYSTLLLERFFVNRQLPITIPKLESLPVVRKIDFRQNSKVSHHSTRDQ